MKEKIKKFYEEHEDEVKTAGVWGAILLIGTPITYLIITPFLILWKKLGLYDNK